MSGAGCPALWSQRYLEFSSRLQVTPPIAHACRLRRRPILPGRRRSLLGRYGRISLRQCVCQDLAKDHTQLLKGLLRFGALHVDKHGEEFVPKPRKAFPFGGKNERRR